MHASLSFDGYTSYSESSTPRTPSPRDDYHPGPYDKQPQQFGDDSDSYYRGPLLQDLYEQDSPYTPEWQGQHVQHIPQPQQPQQQHRTHEYPMMRRNTFPSVRGDMPNGQYPPFAQQPHGYPQSEYNEPHQQFLPPYPDESVKLEESASHIVPTQSPPFYRPSSSGGMPSPPHQYMNQAPVGYSTYLSPHTGLPVQHTDDAASKETQYLRRRCFNCHTTEPPSWRRSTLNPGKIVCNKCGLYERTHLRPRPLRFDELRAGNKARKAGTKAAQAVALHGSPKVKKEPSSGGTLLRRASVSSNASVHSSNGANSDWDDSGEFP